MTDKKRQRIELNNSKNSGQIGISDNLIQIMISELNVFQRRQRFNPTVLLGMYAVSAVFVAISTLTSVSHTSIGGAIAMGLGLPLIAGFWGFVPLIGEIMFFCLTIMVFMVLSVQPGSTLGVVGFVVATMAGIKVRNILIRS